MTDAELRDAAVAALKQTTVSYPEWERRRAQGSYPDVTKTKWWQAFNLLGQISALPPQTVIRNAATVGVEVTSRQDLVNYLIDTTGDSGIIFERDAAGSTANRIVMRNIALTNAVPWGKHGIYGKVPNLTLTDLDIQCSRFCASGISLRFHGAHVDGFKVSGAPHAVTYYETDFADGDITLIGGDCAFDADTGVWIDIEGSPQYPQTVTRHFLFHQVSMSGPGAYLKVSRTFSGSVRLESCTLNGRPVTAADCPAVPNLTIA